MRRGSLKGMVLLRPGNRLSITPVEAAHWKFILSLEMMRDAWCACDGPCIAARLAHLRCARL